MKRNRRQLLFILLCLTLTVTLTLSVNAVRVVTSPEEYVEIALEHSRSCHGATDCAHTDIVLKFANNGNRSKDEDRRILIACAHESKLFLNDLDNNRIDSVCLGCGFTIPGAVPEATTRVITTSAEIRRACQHEWSAWYPYSTTYHKKNCVLCGESRFESHNRIPATCTEDEYCADCGAADWALRLGHMMGFAPAEQAGMHEHRCVRGDNDHQFVCEYVESVEPCHEVPFALEEENGEHLNYYVCRQCSSISIGETTPCYALLGLPCDACIRGAWEGWD